MIRNIPRCYAEEALLFELSTFFDSSEYDFVYLPRDKSRSSNVGYAFVNFISEDIAHRASAKMKGASWRLVQSNKLIITVPANRQGLTSNLAHYAGRCVVGEGHSRSPLVWANDVPIGFHDAVQRFCAPNFLQELRASLSAHGASDASTCSVIGEVESNPPSATSSFSGFCCENWPVVHTPRHFEQGSTGAGHQRRSTMFNLSREHAATTSSNSVCVSRMRPLVQQPINFQEPPNLPSACTCRAPSTDFFHPKKSDVKATTEYQHAWQSLNYQLAVLCSQHGVPIAI